MATSVFDALDEAVSEAAARFDVNTLHLAGDHVMRLFRELGCKTIDGDVLAYRADREKDILDAMAARLYPGEPNKASSFSLGYRWFDDGLGGDLAPSSRDDADAWLAGRAANPEYAVHVKAQAAADVAFRARFNTNKPVTRKGFLYWSKHYHRARHGFES